MSVVHAPAAAAAHQEAAQRVVWMPFEPKTLPPLPEGLSCHYWDGTDTYPTAPSDVHFLTGFPGTDGYEILSRTLSRAVSLEVLRVLSSGYDYLRPHFGALPVGTRVCTGRGIHAEATAELAVTLLLATARGVPHFSRRQGEGTWAPASLRTLRGKRVLLLGQGAVGTAIAARLRPFGCRLVPVARTRRGAGRSVVHGSAELRELLPAADAVVLAAPLTDETRGLLDAAALASLKDDAILVNVGRGELVDTSALTAEVVAGRIHAALDVLDPEPPPAGHPLWSADNALLTPHVGAFTDAFQEDSVAFLIRQLRRYARNEKLENEVLVA